MRFTEQSGRIIFNTIPATPDDGKSQRRRRRSIKHVNRMMKNLMPRCYQIQVANYITVRNFERVAAVWSRSMYAEKQRYAFGKNRNENIEMYQRCDSLLPSYIIVSY